MPFINPPQKDETGTLDLTKIEGDGVGVGELLSAAVQRETAIGSAINDMNLGMERRLNPFIQRAMPADEASELIAGYESDYDPLDGLEVKYRPFANQFRGIVTKDDADILKRRLDGEIANRDIMERAGGLASFAATAAAQFVDPVNYVPFVGWGGKGASLGRRVAAGVGNALAGTAAQEAVLYSTQRTRTAGESAMNIGASVIFGAALGAGAHAVNQLRLSRDRKMMAHGQTIDGADLPVAGLPDDVRTFGDRLRPETEAQLVRAGRSAEESKASAEIFTRGVQSVLRDIPDAGVRREVMDGIDVEIRAGGTGDGASGLAQSKMDKGGRSLAPSRNADVEVSAVSVAGESPKTRNEAYDHLKASRGSYSLASGEAVQVTAAARKMIGKSFPPDRLRLVPALSNIIRSSVAYAEEDGFLHAVSAVDMDGVQYAVRTTFKTGDTHQPSLYSIEGFESAPFGGELSRGPAVSGEVGATPKRIVGDLVAAVNSEAGSTFPHLQDIRGLIRLPDGGGASGKTIIELMQDADASTFVHEAAHFFASILEDANARSGGDTPLKARVDAMRKEFGDMATPEAQEKFAQGFEAYLHQGKAPASALREVFERFREWLVGIYARATDIGIDLTPEMARLYDELMLPDIGEIPGPYGVSKPRSLSAAAVAESRIFDPDTGEYREVQLKDFDLRTKAARLVERTGLNLTPNAKISKSPLVSMRTLYGNMVEDTRDTAASRAGVVGTAIETRVGIDRDMANEQIYRILGRGGKKIKHPNLTHDEFGRRVLDAIANPKDEADPLVLRVANDLSSRVIAPLERKMRDIGMLAEIQKWRNDERYAPHSWDAGRIYAAMPEFKRKMSARVEEALRIGYREEMDKLEQKRSSLFSAVDDLELGAKRREEELNRRVGGDEVDISEDDLRALLMQAQNKPAEDRPQSLLAWVVRQGGIWKGEPLASDVSALEYRRPGFMKRERFKPSSGGDNGGGRMLDDLRERAIADGYLAEDATIQNLIDAMAAEVRGKPLYSRVDESAAQAWEAYDEFLNHLGQMGVDPSGRRILRKTSAGQRELIRRTAEALGKLDEARAAKLRRDAAELDGKIKDLEEGLNDPNQFRSEVDQITDEVTSKLTGEDKLVDSDIDLEINLAGPLKRRTIDVKRSEFSEFMTHDAFAAITGHMHRMVGEYHLTRNFGRADMKWDIESIAREADGLKQRLDGPAREALEAQLEAHLQIVRTSRDKLRGTYEHQFKGWGNDAARSLSSLAYTVQLGNVMASSVADIARPVMTHQMSLLLRSGWPRLKEGAQAAFRDLDKDHYFMADRAGAVFERISNTRMASMMDLEDNFGPKGRFERVANNMASWASRLSLIDRWNEFGKTLVTGLYMDRLGSMSQTAWKDLRPGDQAYLSLNRISEYAWPHVAAAIQKHGVMERGVWRLNLSMWTDQDLAAIVRGGMRKEADSMIVTPGIGSKVQTVGRLNMAGPLGRLLLQYKNFWIAAHEKVVLRAAQNPEKSQIASGALAMTVIGMMIDEFKAWSGNYELSNNLGTRIMGGLDRAGVIPLWMEINNMAERGLSVPGAYAIAGGAASLLGDDDAGGIATRYRNRDTFASLAGPAMGLVGTSVQVFGDVARSVRGADSGITESTVGSALDILPYNNIPAIKEMLDWYAEPALKAFVAR